MARISEIKNIKIEPVCEDWFSWLYVRWIAPDGALGYYLFPYSQRRSLTVATQQAVLESMPLEARRTVYPVTKSSRFDITAKTGSITKQQVDELATLIESVQIWGFFLTTDNENKWLEIGVADGGYNLYDTADELNEMEITFAVANIRNTR